MSKDHPLEGDEDFKLTITQRGRAPDDREFVITRTEHSFQGEYSRPLNDTGLTISATIWFQVGPWNEILGNTREGRQQLFNIKISTAAPHVVGKKQIVLLLARNLRLTDFDNNMFRDTHSTGGEQSILMKRGTCNLCRGIYTIKNIHKISEKHQWMEFGAKLTTDTRDRVIDNVPKGLFFDNTKKDENEWSITNRTKTLPLTLFAELPNNYTWISVVYYNKCQGIQLVSFHDIVTNEKQIQYIEVNRPVNTGVNTCGSSLRVTSDLPLEAKVDLLYEVEMNNKRKTIKFTLAVKQGITEDFYLEPLDVGQQGRIQNLKSKANLTFLGKNFINIPPPEPRFLKPVLDKMELIIKDKDKPKNQESHKGMKVNADHLAANWKLMEDKISPENFSEKTKLCILLEANKSEQHGASFNVEGIKSAMQAYDENESRITLMVRSSNLGRLQIKPGFQVCFTIHGNQFAGHLERAREDSCSFVVQKQISEIDTTAIVNITKMSNQFLTHIFLTSLQVVEEKKLLNYFFPHHPTPMQAFSPPMEFCQTLHQDQQDAVKKAITHDVNVPFLLSGPAGSGKSRVILEIILQILVEQPCKKILLVNPTNHGLIELCKKLTFLLNNYTGLRFRALKIVSPTQPKGPSCNHCYLNADGTRHEYPTPEYIKDFSVLMCTPSVAYRLGYMEELKLQFSAIIIDEAAFLTEVETLVSLVPHLPEDNELKPLVILAGDVVQLTYQPRSDCAKAGGYGLSTMKRLSESDMYLQHPEFTSNLQISFRNPVNMVNLMNSMAYKGKSQVQSAVTSHNGTIHACHSTSITKKAAGKGDNSKYSHVEAATCLILATESRKRNPDKTHVILCVYIAQVAVLKQIQEAMFPEERNNQRFKVLTSETIQGSEADIVFLSTTIQGEYPKGPAKYTWTADINRLTMCISRARHDFYLVGDLLLLNRLPGFRKVITKATSMGQLYCHRNIKKLLDIDNRQIY